MNKFIFTLFACILLAGTLAAQPGGEPAAGSKPTTGEKKGWPSAERYAFINSCIEEAKGGMSKDTARFYCYCMQERVEKKYPAIEEAAKLTEEDMLEEAFQEDILDCLLGASWDTKSRNDFLVKCINTEKRTVGAEKAKLYCECMLFQVEKAFPDAAEAILLTPEKLKTPEWKKITQGCRNF
jgi:hypothetical protein